MHCADGWRTSRRSRSSCCSTNAVRRILPANSLARYRFLGLEPFVPRGIANRVNVTADSVDLDEDVRRRLVELYSSDVHALSMHFADLDLSLWPNFSGLGVR